MGRLIHRVPLVVALAGLLLLAAACQSREQVGTTAPASPVPATTRLVPTAPVPATPAPGTTRLVVFGDVNNWESDTPIPAFDKVGEAMADTHAAAAISTGDALNDDDDTSIDVALYRWGEYMAVESRTVGAVMPVWRTAGDNDRLDVPARLSAWNRVFSSYPTSPDPNRRWYSKDVGNIHLVFMNTASQGRVGWMGYGGPRSAGNSAQAEWLVRDLRSHTSAHPGRSTIIVVTHYPLFNGKTIRPYAGEKKAEARALHALFARYGVDMVLTGDTHVYRRTTMTVRKAGRRYRLPYVQIPPAAASARSFGVEPIPALGSAEAGWAPGTEYRGFLQLDFDAAARTLALSVRKVSVDDGTTSSAEGQRANEVALGGEFADVPVGAAP